MRGVCIVGVTMLIEPMRRIRYRPVALVYPGHRTLHIVTEAGEHRANGARRCHELLEHLADHVLYTPGSCSSVRHTTTPKAWEARVWNRRTTSMHLVGTKVRVYSLRGVLDDSTDQMGDLLKVTSWLADHDTPAGSLSSMAWNLWRNTLPTSILFQGESDDSVVGRLAFYGGRQECLRPGTFSHVTALDISGAYPHAMADPSRGYARRLKEVNKSTTLDPMTGGIAQAVVRVPSDIVAPLPRRITGNVINWPWGTLRGVWPWCELAAAADLGCDVRIRRSWAPDGDALHYLFADWFDVIARGRDLGGPPARMVKRIANALWGQFAMDHKGVATARFTGIDRWKLTFSPTHKMPHRHITHIAAETSARVRRRLLLEGLTRLGVPALHIDTDGFIVRRSAVRDFPVGEGIGAWRVKSKMTKVEIRAPQVYRYLCGKGCGIHHAAWHYNVSGTPPNLAPLLFDKTGRKGLTVSLGSHEITVPATNAAEVSRMRLFVRMALSSADELGPNWIEEDE